MDSTLYNVIFVAGVCIQAFSSVLTVIVVWLAFRDYKRNESRDAHTDRCNLEAREIEIYQRIEIESFKVFRYEADYRNTIRWYKTNLAPYGHSGFDASVEESNLCARKYYEMTCNLFEIAIRLREKNCDYIEDEVFGTWITWFFDVCCEWGFRAVWADLRDNYTNTLRSEVFDPLVEELIRLWDEPHAANPQLELRQSELVLKPMREHFYSKMCGRFGCVASKIWPKPSLEEPNLKHPRAYV